MNFDQAFDVLLGHEGGYVNNPADPGGATRWGITARVALQNGYTGDMRAFPVEQAKVIARRSYWDAAQIESLPDEVRFDVFDTAYNSGVSRAAKLLQLAADVPDDGVIGPHTLTAVRAMNPWCLAMRFNGFRLRFLVTLPTWGSFGKGWANRVATNLIGSA